MKFARRTDITGLLSVVLFTFTLHASPAQTVPGPASSPPGPPAGASPKAQGLMQQTYLFGDFNGERSHLADEGFSFTPSYTAETFGNPIGGVKQGAIYDGLLELQLTLDFKKMADWDGSLHASAYCLMGNGLTGTDTHDLLMVSNVAGYNTPLLFELWYEQKFLADKVALRVGQLSADSEFFISSSAANFLNSTYGWPAVMASNVPAPAYPYAAPGVRLAITPDPHWQFLSAVFAGDPAPDRIGDPNPNRTPGNDFDNSGASFNIDGSDGFFAISELQYNLNKEDGAKGLPGTYKVGGWFHTGTFSDQRYDNTGNSLASPASDGIPRARDGNNGLYFVADQALWQDKSDPNQTKEVDLFLRAGNALGDRSTFDYYIDGGLFFNGLIPGHPGDFFGVATAYGHIAGGLQGFTQDENTFTGSQLPIPDFEQNIELTYSKQLAPWWTVQPDLQVLIHPGGSSAVPNAVVLGVRTVISF